MIKAIRIFGLSCAALGVALIAALVILQNFVWRYSPPVGEILSKRSVNDDRVKLLIVGDTGSGDEHQMRVADGLEKRCQVLGGIDGLIILGDIAYQSGMSSLDDEQWQSKVEQPYGRPCLGAAPIFPILGNHDAKHSELYPQYSKGNPRWHMPHRFYGVDFGNMLRVTFLDSTQFDICWNADKCTADFLKQQITTNAAQFHLVAAHHPLASSSDHGPNYDGRNLMSFLLRQVACGSIDTWLSGHAHHLEHYRTSHCATDIVISGGGGGSLYGIEQTTEDSQFAKQTFGYVELIATWEMLEYRFFDDHDRLLYSFRRGVQNDR